MSSIRNWSIKFSIKSMLPCALSFFILGFLNWYMLFRLEPNDNLVEFYEIICSYNIATLAWMIKLVWKPKNNSLDFGNLYKLLTSGLAFFAIVASFCYLVDLAYNLPIDRFIINTGLVISIILDMFYGLLFTGVMLTIVLALYIEKEEKSE